MSTNPYSPPTAEVADVAPEIPQARPEQIGWVVRIMWVAYVIGLFPGIIRIYDIFMGNGIAVGFMVLVFALFVLGVGFAIALWFIGKLSAGKNWARILMLTLVVFGILFSAIAFSMLRITFPALQIVTYAVQYALHLIALGLMFSAPGKYWFNRGQ